MNLNKTGNLQFDLLPPDRNGLCSEDLSYKIYFNEDLDETGIHSFCSSANIENRFFKCTKTIENYRDETNFQDNILLPADDIKNKEMNKIEISFLEKLSVI